MLDIDEWYKIPSILKYKKSVSAKTAQKWIFLYITEYCRIMMLKILPAFSISSFHPSPYRLPQKAEQPLLDHVAHLLVSLAPVSTGF